MLTQRGSPNPSSPPKTVRWGENTVDEMCIAFLEFVPVEEAKTAADLKAPRPGELLREALMSRLGNRKQNISEGSR